MRKTYPHNKYLLACFALAIASFFGLFASLPSDSEPIPTLAADALIRGEVPVDNPELDKLIAATPIPEQKIEIAETPPPIEQPTPPPATATTAPSPKPKPTQTPTPTPTPTHTAIQKLIPVVQAATCASGNFYEDFLCLLNDYRKSKGLGAVAYNSTLNATAKYHATWMSQNKILSHEGEDGSRFYQRCELHETSCDAENVARGYTGAKMLLEAWKGSPGHNKNLLGSHTVIGLSLVGTYSDLVMR